MKRAPCFLLVLLLTAMLPAHGEAAAGHYDRLSCITLTP